MANERVKKFENKVYVRKIVRNMLKRKYKTNYIKNIWHKMQGKPYYSAINKNKR